MLEKKYFQKVRKDLLAYSGQRREVIKIGGDAQHLAKKAIFALQRDNTAEALEYLTRARELLQGLNKAFKGVRGIFDEGSYRAALEEYTEARLFELALAGKPIGEIKDFAIDSDMFIGGLADVPGELLRYAIFSATEKRFGKVKKCCDLARDIVAEMVDMDLTGYNRQKFDQAKQSLHKLEQVMYEVSIRDYGNRGSNNF